MLGLTVMRVRRVTTWITASAKEHYVPTPVLSVLNSKNVTTVPASPDASAKGKSESAGLLYR